MLEQFVTASLFSFILIFCRIGAGIMLLPGFAETYVSPRIRLSLAALISLILTPVLQPSMPAFPTMPSTLFILVVAELLTGIFIGTICRILISATHIAGMIFSFQAGLSSAVIFDVSQSSQGSLSGNFLGILALVLVFTTGLHGFMLRGIAESYSVFAPGQFPPLADFTSAVAHVASATFIIAVQITAPVLVGGTLLFLGAGILSRLMPNLQVFFLIVPVQVIVNFFILIAAFSAMMLWYMDYFREQLTSYLGYLR